MRTPLVLAVAAAVVLAPTPAFASAGDAPGVSPVGFCHTSITENGAGFTVQVAGVLAAPGAVRVGIWCDIRGGVTGTYYGGARAEAYAPAVAAFGSVVTPDVSLLICTTTMVEHPDSPPSESYTICQPMHAVVETA